MQEEGCLQENREEMMWKKKREEEGTYQMGKSVKWTLQRRASILWFLHGEDESLPALGIRIPVDDQGEAPEVEVGDGHRCLLEGERVLCDVLRGEATMRMKRSGRWRVISQWEFAPSYYPPSYPAPVSPPHISPRAESGKSPARLTGLLPGLEASSREFAFSGATRRSLTVSGVAGE